MPNQRFLYKKDLDDPYYKILLPYNVPHLIKGEDDGNELKGMNINQILKKDYPQLYESIQEEKYFISDDYSCYYFFEIPADNDDIIGFASFEIYNTDSLLLNQIYVLPKHRGKQHFYNILNYFIDLFDEANIMIKNPNKNIINQLDNVDVFIKLDERFWLSKIQFMYDLVPYNDALKYTNKDYNERNKFEESIKTNLYDAKLGALVNITRKNNNPYTGQENSNAKISSISLVKEEDEKKYHYLKKRNEDSWIKNGNYFKKVKKNLKNNKFFKTFNYQF